MWQCNGEWLDRQGFSGEVKFEPIPEWERAGQGKIEKKCKGPMVGTSWQEGCVNGVWQARLRILAIQSNNT